MVEYSIRNMVCARCMKTVTAIFREEGITPCGVRLGAVETQEALDDGQVDRIAERLKAEGFELLSDQKSRLIEKIKNEIVQLVHHGELDEMKLKLSGYLAGRLQKDYTYLSNLFSSVEGTTVEQYFILQKIEKAKELLVYNELSLGEIAFRLGYSSVAHLSNQFKRVTGLTPSAFKKLKGDHRKPIDEV